MNTQKYVEKIPAEVKAQLENAIAEDRVDEIWEALTDRVHDIAEQNATDSFDGDLDSDEFDDVLAESSHLASEINNAGILVQAGYLYTYTAGGDVTSALSK